jgi:hypothetical protein
VKYLSATVLACIGASCWSAELVMRDFDIALESMPSEFEYTLSDEAGERDGTDTFDSGYGLAIGGTYSFAGPGSTHGMLAKLDATYATYAYGGSGSMTTYGFRVGGGYGYAISDNWTIAGIVHAGAGLSNLELPGNELFSTFTADGIYLAYGANLVAGYAVTDHIIVKLSAGYLMTTQALSAKETDIDLTIDTTGLTASLGLTWRFSTYPWRLE